MKLQGPLAAFNGDDTGLPPVAQRTGNFMYGPYLFLLDELEDEKTYYAIADLTRFVNEEANAGKTLYIVINSCGGSVFLANTIIGLINLAKFHDINVYTYVYGWAASAASMIAIQGDIRYMSRSALHFIHFGVIPSYLTKATEITKSAKFASKLQEQAENAYLSKCPGLTKEKYLTLTEDEMGYVFAPECLKLGFCDGILEDELDQKLLEQESIMNAFNQVCQEQKKISKKSTKKNTTSKRK